MSRIRDLSSIQLKGRLQDSGLVFQTGPFSINLQSKLEGLAESIASLYADLPVCLNAPFADFHIRILQPQGLRRWWRPQVLFHFQGRNPFSPYPLKLAFPLHEWGMNWCIATFAHQYMVIHSAVVERDGMAMLLTALPGSGKSTLAAALTFRGWRLLSDELTLVRPADGQIIPLARPISLKNESIEVIRKFAPDAFISPICCDKQKETIAHLRPPRESVDRAFETASPGLILFVSYSANAETQLKPIPKARSFIRVAESSFNYSLLGTTGFETMARLIDMCDCYDFTYSDLDDAVGRLSSIKR